MRAAAGSATCGGTLAIVNGKDVATFATKTLTVGTHNVTATYNGSATFAASTSAPAPSVTVKAGTATTLAASTPAPTVGKAVTSTATVKNLVAGGGTPAGAPNATVTFMDGKVALGTGTLAVVKGNLVATFTTSALTVGTPASRRARMKS